ncbi:hypothetical protein SAY87_012408 [Trapa incisa]|uniref:gibberellin 2beta-dioxygenase n=1 Tax=Trapa incisa TaxID=236973 RepID=A0AAN7GHE2_9MYRT|nr:hypothetical protein SAY87_012408 [Trapa incisa]
MVVLSKPVIQHFSSPFILNQGPVGLSSESQIPLIDLSEPDAKHAIVKACEDFGFFKVVSHGVPLDFISNLESEAVGFFSLPPSEKEKAGPANPFGYGNKKIGPNGDVGWVEYLLLKADTSYLSKLPSGFGNNPEKFRSAVNDYILAVRKMGCEILELMADGLKIQQRNVLSKLLMDEQSDSAFRLNHYPPCPEVNEASGDGAPPPNMIGFGEHTDPQIISILRSNNISGLQISTMDGSWIPVPPDQTSFFINVGDSLQVMTNGRFKSVRHRVMANGSKSRLSMIYFGGPPLSERIVPLPALVKGKESLYKEFTWFEYKKSSYKSRLSDNRLALFQRIAAT